MSRSVLILGAGFGGLELSTLLSDEFGDEIEVTVIDRAESFVFGFSKLDLMFRGTARSAVEIPYRAISKPGVRMLREEVTAIDPETRTVTTDAGSHQADVLVIALGADYDLDATPGLAEHGREFYSVDAAENLAETVTGLSSGRVVIGVCGAPFKCPPAPSETAMMLNDELERRGVRGDCEITLTMPLGSPVPPSPETSAAIQVEFDRRGIEFLPGRRVASLEPGKVNFKDGSALEFDLFLGVPKHRAPDVVIRSGLAEDGYVPVSSATLETRFPGVYAIGDVATAGVPKAGVFSEAAAGVVARELTALFRGGKYPPPFDGRASCYIEFGGDRVARVDIDFLSGPEKTGKFQAPSAALNAEKADFGSDRRRRWFGL